MRLSVNGTKDAVLKLLSRGKGGYSYRAERDGPLAVIKRNTFPAPRSLIWCGTGRRTPEFEAYLKDHRGGPAVDIRQERLSPEEYVAYPIASA